MEIVMCDFNVGVASAPLRPLLSVHFPHRSVNDEPSILYTAHAVLRLPSNMYLEYFDARPYQILVMAFLLDGPVS